MQQKSSPNPNVVKVPLNNGTSMPNFGLGTYKMTELEPIRSAVSKVGYRMYDCASFYKNEEIVGEALSKLDKEDGVKREDLYIISKAWYSEVNDCEAACRRSLKKLGVDCLDLYLVHWPFTMDGTEGPQKSKLVMLPMHKIWE